MIERAGQLGRNIAHARKAAAMTQTALAEKVGVCKQTISSWEHGAAMPDAIMLAHIARELSCTADSLLGLDEEGGAEVAEAADQACFL